MMNFLKKLLGLADTKQAGHSTLPGSRSFQASVQGGSEGAIRGQLVQVMMRDVMRENGIPTGWIECHIQFIDSRSRGPGVYVRLVVKHWDSRLMQYMFAFQKALLTAIVHFEPKAATWIHGISWQLEVASTCTQATLPDKSYWLEAPQTDTPVPVPLPVPTRAIAQPVIAVPVIPAVTAAASAQVPSEAFKPVALTEPLPPLFEIEKPTPENDATADLERLFAIRDNELSRQAANNPMPVGYEKTEPAPL